MGGEFLRGMGTGAGKGFSSGFRQSMGMQNALIAAGELGVEGGGIPGEGGGMRLTPGSGTASLTREKTLLGMRKTQADIDSMAIKSGLDYARGVAGEFGLDSSEFSKAFDQGYTKAKTLLGLASQKSKGIPVAKGKAPTALDFMGTDDTEESTDDPVKEDLQFIMSQPEADRNYYLEHLKSIAPETHAMAVEVAYQQLVQGNRDRAAAQEEIPPVPPAMPTYAMPGVMTPQARLDVMPNVRPMLPNVMSPQARRPYPRMR